MVNERTVYLINAGIDGELGPQERAELDTVLDASAEARTLQAELRRLATVMESLPEREPPAGLAERILDRIRLPGPSRHAAAHSPRFSLSGLFASFQPAQAGLAFAAGLLVTVGFYETALRDGGSDDLSNMVGTMVANSTPTVGELQGTLTIAQPGLSGTVFTSEVGDFVVMNFNLDLAQRSEILIDVAAAGMSFGGVARASADDNSIDERYEVSGGKLRVVNQGRQQFQVFLRHAGGVSAGVIDIEVNQPDGSVFRGSLPIGGSGA
jgi:hypothetical protein